MNFDFFINLHPKALAASWRWVPKVRCSSWRLGRGGRVWYFNFRWLCFGFQLDNEW